MLSAPGHEKPVSENPVSQEVAYAAKWRGKLEGCPGFPMLVMYIVGNMRRFWCCLIIAAAVSELPAMSQSRNQFLGSVSVGYSYATGGQLPLSLGQALPLFPSRVHFNGWEASVGVPFSRIVGLSATFGGLYTSQNSTAIVCNAHVVLPPVSCNTGSVHGSVGLYTGLFGPRVAITLHRFTPFAEALFGFAITTGRGTFTPSSAPFYSVPPQRISQVSFGDALGAGIAYQLSHRFDWHLRADLLQNTVTSLATTPAPLTHQIESNLMVSIGISFQFPAWRQPCRKNK